MKPDPGTEWLIEQSVQESAARRTFDSPEHRARWLTGARRRRRRLMRIDQWRRESRDEARRLKDRGVRNVVLSPVDAVAQREELDNARAAMAAKLTGRQRELLRLVACDVSYRNIGDALQMKVGTVKSQINRAKAALA